MTVVVPPVRRIKFLIVLRAVSGKSNTNAVFTAENVLIRQITITRMIYALRGALYAN
jgi:hypothetical protein